VWPSKFSLSFALQCRSVFKVFVFSRSDLSNEVECNFDPMALRFGNSAAFQVQPFRPTCVPKMSSHPALGRPLVGAQTSISISEERALYEFALPTAV